MERRDKARQRYKERRLKAHLNSFIDINIFQVVVVSKIASSSENNGSRNYKSIQVLIVCLKFNCILIVHNNLIAHNRSLPTEDIGDKTGFTGWQLCSFQKAFIRHTAK